MRMFAPTIMTSLREDARSLPREVVTALYPLIRYKIAKPASATNNGGLLEKMKHVAKLLFCCSALMLSACLPSKGPVGRYANSQQAGSFLVRPYWRLRGMSTFVYGVKVELQQDSSFVHWTGTGCLSFSHQGTWTVTGDTLRLVGHGPASNGRIPDVYLISGRKLKPLKVNDFPLTLKKRS